MAPVVKGKSHQHQPTFFVKFHRPMIPALIMTHKGKKISIKGMRTIVYHAISNKQILKLNQSLSKSGRLYVGYFDI